MKQLIVNADDFGANAGVNRGVLAAHHAGGLSSATLMAAGEAFAEAAAMARTAPELGVGVHLVLAGGLPPVAPPADVPTLVSADGRLWRDLGAFARRWAAGRIDPADVETEIGAQLNRVREAGITPTHVDAHKHVFVIPGVMRRVAAVCRRRGIGAVRNPFDADPLAPGLAPPGGRPRRMLQWLFGRSVRLARPGWRRAAAGLWTPDRFYGVAATGLWTAGYLERVIAGLTGGCAELMTHPGVLDASLRASRTRLKESRQAELDLLCGALPPLLARHGVTLRTFANPDA